MITAETITDEQIIELRDVVSETGDGYRDARGEYLPTTIVLEWCDEALSDPETEPKAFARIRRNARARLVEIINAREIDRQEVERERRKHDRADHNTDETP